MGRHLFSSDRLKPCNFGYCLPFLQPSLSLLIEEGNRCSRKLSPAARPAPTRPASGQPNFSASPTGGHLPPGFETLDGPRPEFAKLYAMVEFPGGYRERTRKNVRTVEGTLSIASNWASLGEKCTATAMRDFRKPSIDVDIRDPITVARVVEWIRSNHIGVLNVAGNTQPRTRTARSFGIIAFAEEYLAGVFFSPGHHRLAGA
ncbi:MAG: hypothetical protein NTV55_14745 [Planctomycetota bacterium]|nr:hypothetical protein [Planctomycetota bacterium]